MMSDARESPPADDAARMPLASLAAQSGIPERVLEEIAQLAGKHSLSTVILFGSRARGDYRPTSDIDLAVRGGDETMFALDVDEYTWTLLKFDVVELERNLSPEFRAEIERDGKVVYEKA